MNFDTVHKLNIPTQVAGRTVTNRGVHLLPFGYHTSWMEKGEEWAELLVSMGISWVVMITDGDSVTEKVNGISPVELLLAHGVIPIVRDGTTLYPNHFTNYATPIGLVPLFAQYGLAPMWIIGNEPFDSREWVGDKVPPRDEAWDIVAGVWMDAATQLANAGVWVGFPDGPTFSRNPFIEIYNAKWIFDEGLGFYTGHHYGKGRHRDYPYDAVTRFGVELTESEYTTLLDDFASYNDWREEPLWMINARREELKNPHGNAVDDPTCFRGWEQIVHYSKEAFGYVVPMAMTEGGWVPRDRAGSGSDIDLRQPHTTPKMVAKKTLQSYDMASPLFGICHWLLGDDSMVPGGVGWPYDSWTGWAFADIYGFYKPVVDMLKHVSPKEIETRIWPALFTVNGDSASMGYMEQYNIAISKGAGNFKITELHEYGGSEFFEGTVITSEGLPISGVNAMMSFPSSGTTECISMAAVENGRFKFGLFKDREANITIGTGNDSISKVKIASNGRYVNAVWQLKESQYETGEVVI